MKNTKNQKGITLVALVITIIVLLIIASISITQGRVLVDKEKTQTIETNMLTIKSKAKEYAENVEAKNWTISDSSNKEQKNKEEFQNTYLLTLVDDNNKSNYANNSSWYESGYTYYSLSQEALNKMGLNDLYEEENIYVIRYKIEENKNDLNFDIDIIYTSGITYNNNTYYKLSELENAL